MRTCNAVRGEAKESVAESAGGKDFEMHLRRTCATVIQVSVGG